MLIVIAIVALVVLAGIAIIAAIGRRQTDEAIGILSRETKSRDKATTASVGSATSGRQLEKATALERRVSSKDLVLSGAGAPPAPYVPPDPDVIGVSRRQFFNRTLFALMGFGLTVFGVQCIAFLWPQLSGGFGSKIKVGLVSDILAEIRGANGFLYKAEGRMWLTEYPNAAVDKARATYSPGELAGMTAGVELGLDGGIVALYQKCPHLGCRVPSCATSQWFECPCHGSQYNRVGEKKGGPAPRGMDRFATEVSAGVFSVDTGTIINGPAIGTNTTGQEAEGPNCVGAASH